MIRLRCSTCQKVLGVKPELAGRIVLCPACKTKLRVPAGEAIKPEVVEPDVVEDLEVVKPPSPITSARPKPVPSRRERDDDDDDNREDEDEEYQRRPRRRKRRKRRRSSSASFGGMDPFWMTVIGVSIVTLGSIALALAVPPSGPLVQVLGNGLALVGGVWILVVAFMEDTTQGILCLCVPCYSLYYIITHFDEVKIPAVLQIAGIIIQVVGIAVMGMPGRH